MVSYDFFCNAYNTSYAQSQRTLDNAEKHLGILQDDSLTILSYHSIAKTHNKITSFILFS